MMEQCLASESNPPREGARIHSLGTSMIDVVGAILLRSLDSGNPYIQVYYRQSLISLLDNCRSSWIHCENYSIIIMIY